jgi:hypothetical protein
MCSRRDFWNAMPPSSTGGMYQHSLGADEGQERVRAADGLNDDRLVTRKKKSDSAHLYRGNKVSNPRCLARTRHLEDIWVTIDTVLVVNPCR